jgi:putative hemolysin
LEESLDGPSTELIGIVASILIGAVFAAVDAALSAFGEHRARALRGGQDADARAAARYLAQRDQVHARLLAGRVLGIATAAVLASHLASRLDGVVAGMIAAAGVAGFYAITAGFFQTLAASRASRVAMPLLRWIRPLELMMAPFAIPLTLVSALTRKLLPARPEDDPKRVTELDVERLIEQGEETGTIPEDHAELLLSLLEFTDTVAREVMVPRTRMVAIDIDTPLEEVSRLIIEKGHSRYPVYRERIDQIEGILYAKDLFRVMGQAGPKGKLEDIIRRPAFFVVESQKISSLLREMQARRIHLAVVVDEFGGTAGMVTLEDILEEIVGEIRDEHDFEEVPVRKLGQGRYMANAEISVYDLAETIGLELPEEEDDYGSLGGLVVELAGRVPGVGEAVHFLGYDLFVRDADERHVKRVEVVPNKDVASAAE